MAAYLWTVKTPDGNPGVQKVVAASPEAARVLLEEQGFTELRLQDDDFSHALQEGLRSEDSELNDIEFTAEEELGFKKRRNVVRDIWNDLKAWSWAVVPLVIWNGFHVYRGLAWRVSDVSAAGLLGIILYLIVTLRAVSVCYNRLLHAATYGHWRTMTALIKALRFLRWFNGLGIPEHELIFRQAQVLFETRGMQAAVQCYSVCADHPAVPKMLYWSRLSSFYFAAQRFQEGLEIQKRAFECGKKSTSEYIDRAYHLAHYGRDAGAAREALTEVEGKEVAEIARSYLDMVKGMISYLEGRFGEARSSLDAALLQAHSLTIGTPLTQGHIRLIESYLCLACARLGESERAKRLFRRTARYLKVQHEQRLLEECREQLKGSQGVPSLALGTA